MSWARVDDAWWSHRKVITLDLEARGLWVSALSYTCHQRDPHIPTAIVTVMGGTPEIAARLVAAGLWKTNGDGWVFHDWDEYQSTSAKRAEAGRKGGEKSAETRRSKSAEANPEANEANASKQTKQTVEANEASESKQAHPSPSQPIPSQPDPSEDGDRKRPQNPLWDAVVQACGWKDQPLTKSQKGRTAAAVKELAEIGATPEQVLLRSRHYRQRYPGMDVTPNALAANWASIATPPPPVKQPGQYDHPGWGGVPPY